MSTNKNLVQSVIPATLPYHFSTENTTSIRKEHNITPLTVINISASNSIADTMTDNNISKESSVHMDDKEYQDTKLLITVPASDKEQTFELLNFTPAGCVSVLNMLQHDLGTDPTVLNNGPVISCVTTAIFCNHPPPRWERAIKSCKPTLFPQANQW